MKRETSLFALLEWRWFGECAGCNRASLFVCLFRYKRPSLRYILWIGSGLCFWWSRTAVRQAHLFYCVIGYDIIQYNSCACRTATAVLLHQYCLRATWCFALRVVFGFARRELFIVGTADSNTTGVQWQHMATEGAVSDRTWQQTERSVTGHGNRRSSQWRDVTTK